MYNELKYEGVTRAGATSKNSVKRKFAGDHNRGSPAIRPSVLEERHELAQRFKELVGVGAGVDHQVSPVFAWQVVEAGLVVAKEQ